ncbi:hypothetical protein CEE45_02375 [Candidatus Heimdallarchaeota archaeon B3_Heim]|nr:MAG: hypothetical protein CEE45_02375 [Candidatus Heimdallarchaeota archaeon B3_Heim]
MVKIQFSDIRTLTVIVVLLTALDFFITTILVSPTDFSDFSIFILSILLLITLIILILAYKIWKIILTEEYKVKTRHKKSLLIVAILTMVAGIMGFLVYTFEIILSSSLLGTIYLEFDLTPPQDGIGIAYLLMILTYIFKYCHNLFAITGCILTGVIWTRQFRVWARFSEAPFVKSFYFVGMTTIVLFLDQIATTTLQYYLNLVYPEATKLSDYPMEFQIIIMVLLLIAQLGLPVYIYFLAVARENIQIPNEAIKPKSKRGIMLPLVFFFLYFLVNMANFGGDSGTASKSMELIGNGFLVIVFIPISIGFFGHMKRVESAFLKKNLFLAAIGTLALATFNVVGPSRWTGMTVLVGYLIAFSILTWSLANISQFLGSREALLGRLRKAGAQFLSDMGEAEMKDQSIQKMAQVMTDVTKSYMEDLTKIEVRTPPTAEEILDYVATTMGIKTTTSEAEVLAYLNDAITFMQQSNTEG